MDGLIRDRYLTYRASPQALQHIRAMFHELAQAMSEVVSPCRELSIAQTKIEEASMWAVKAYARQEGEPNESSVPDTRGYEQ